MIKFTLLCCWLLPISTAYSALQTPIDFNFTFNGSTAVQIVWTAYPGKSYVLQTATNLSGTWSNSSTCLSVVKSTTTGTKPKL
jgi:hypothetical protein